MTTSTTTIRKNRLLPALGLAAVLLAGLSGPAKADPPHGFEHGPPPRPVIVHDEWHAHEVYAHYWRLHHPHPVITHVYAPPVVYTAPPPAPSGLNLIIPLHID